MGLLCYPTRDYLRQEFSTGAEVKEFALKRVPEGLTILEVASLTTRPGWVFPIPSWNFGGKWLVADGRVMEASQPMEDIRQLLAGVDAAAIEAAKLVEAVDLDGDKRVSLTEFLKVWPGEEAAGKEMFAELDV